MLVVVERLAVLPHGLVGGGQLEAQCLGGLPDGVRVEQPLPEHPHRLGMLTPHAVKHAEHGDAVQLALLAHAALTRHTELSERIIGQAHFLVGDAQVVVGVHVLGLHHLLQPLLELGEHLLDRVLEVVLRRGSGRAAEVVDLPGQLCRQVERVAALGLLAQGLDGRHRHRLVRLGLLGRRGLSTRLERLQPRHQLAGTGMTREGDHHRLEDFPRLLGQPLIEEEARLVALLGRRLFLIGRSFRRGLRDRLFVLRCVGLIRGRLHGQNSAHHGRGLFRLVRVVQPSWSHHLGLSAERLVLHRQRCHARGNGLVVIPEHRLRGGMLKQMGRGDGGTGGRRLVLIPQGHALQTRLGDDGLIVLGGFLHEVLGGLRPHLGKGLIVLAARHEGLIHEGGRGLVAEHQPLVGQRLTGVVCHRGQHLVVGAIESALARDDRFADQRLVADDRRFMAIVDDLIGVHPGQGGQRQLIPGRLRERVVRRIRDDDLLVVRLDEDGVLAHGLHGRHVLHFLWLQPENHEEGGHLGVGGVLLKDGRQVRLSTLHVRAARAQPQHVEELLGSLRRVPGGDVDVVRLLVRVEVLGIDGEDLPQVLERFVVEPVLDVDVGLREQLGELIPGEPHRSRRGRRNGGGRGPRRGRRRGGGSRNGRGGRGNGSARRSGRGGRSGRRRGGPCRRASGRRGARAGRGLSAPREQIRILRIQLGDLVPDAVGLLSAAVVLMDLGEFLVDGDRLGGLSQPLERLGQHAQRLDVTAIRLEGHLELGQGPLLVTLGEVTGGQLLGESDVLGLERGQALGHALVIIRPGILLEILGRAIELLHGLGRHVLARVQLGQLDPRRHVLGVEVHHPLERVERGLGIARLVVVVGDDLEVGHRLGHQPKLLVEFRQLQVHVQEVRVELEDLLVEGNGLQEEAIRGVALGDLGEEVRGLDVVVLLLVQLAHLLEDPHVLRVGFQNLLVLLDGLVIGALRDELRGGFDDLVLVHRAGLPTRLTP
ncbi:hypothetical protein STIAU_7806 [Stigmatella aurantiaca DW4/3-1]|uniref:Uncharacterized protein n=1 Tax=Stigmatella aurantiaca (strain DW4/3-1) TaxID=378806 RepID=Q08Z09_STIAD|nr:hypothetical protein STIAU_7806 [Stigmatella aurantiaca DW4/3-1]